MSEVMSQKEERRWSIPFKGWWKLHTVGIAEIVN